MTSHTHYVFQEHRSNEIYSFSTSFKWQEDTGLPLAEILVLLGFFMIYIVEEVVHHGMDWYYGKYLAKVSIRSRYIICNMLK